MMLSLQFIGGGNMGTALLSGLIKSGFAKPKKLAVIEALPERRETLMREFQKTAILDTPVSGVDAVLAVKPKDSAPALAALKEKKVMRVLSIVAGLRTPVIEKSLPEGAIVVRAMPNTPAMVGESASAIAGGSSAGAADLDWAEKILSSVGRTFKLDESLLDAVTGLSGSGPAYVFYLAEALIEAGVAAGLDKEVSYALTTQTLLGSAQMLTDIQTSPAELRRQVTSPQGTTEKGIEVLESADVKAAFKQAVASAAERAAEIAQELEKSALEEGEQAGDG